MAVPPNTMDLDANDSSGREAGSDYLTRYTSGSVPVVDLDTFINISNAAKVESITIKLINGKTGDKLMPNKGLMAME